MRNTTSARRLALAWCIAAANKLCWTYDTFSSHGRKSSAESNRSFDRIWYAQGALGMLSYKIGNANGVMGRRTRDAIKRFQVRVGMEPNGVIDDRLFDRLLKAIGGAQRLAKALKRELLAKKDEKMTEHAYGYAPPPPASKPAKEKWWDNGGADLGITLPGSNPVSPPPLR
jgi:peptidoglycan hydrolase-like protein with peptidoglycan-binding domain